MRMKPIRKLSFYIDETEEVEILFSVLYHILDQHIISIKSLVIHFTRVKINKDGEMFLRKIFEMPILEELDVSIVK